MILVYTPSLFRRHRPAIFAYGSNPRHHADMALAYGLTEPVDLALSGLPQPLCRLRIAHLTDLHIRRPTKRLKALIPQLAKVKLDLGVLTGDYMLSRHDPGPAIDYLKQLTTRITPALGWVGVYGNHDRPDLIEALADLPVTWLCDSCHSYDEVPLDIIGLRGGLKRIRPDGVSAALAVAKLPEPEKANPRLRIALTHRPDDFPLCSDLGADLALAGHTHGGQIRLPLGIPLFNSSDLPLSLTAGILRHRDTLCLISRGIGSTDLFQTPLRPRIFCPPHVPIYTLRQGTPPGQPTPDIIPIQKW